MKNVIAFVGVFWKLNYPMRIFSFSSFNGCFAKHTIHVVFMLSSFWAEEKILNLFKWQQIMKLQNNHSNDLCNNQRKWYISLSVMFYTCSDYCIFSKCKHILFITGIAQQPTAILAKATGECFQFHTVQQLKYLSFLKEKVWYQMAA